MIGAASAAADFIRSRAGDRAGLEWRSKAPSDFVSDVDTGAERVIRDAFQASIPDASIMGEELSPDAALDARTVIIVDPLDGTTNFLHGYPEYAVSIAAVLDGALSAGVVLNVALGELFTATLGGGAFLDGAPISVSPVDDPSRALIGTGFPFSRHDQLPTYLRQLGAVSRATAGVRRAGSAALDLCDVACGRFEAFWELSLSPWDFAAGMLIVREAGGTVTTVAGDDVPLEPSSILAGNRAMHPWLLETVREAGNA
jgi:myo-inositol-1(or 4)-monophosphatase